MENVENIRQASGSYMIVWEISYADLWVLTRVNGFHVCSRWHLIYPRSEIEWNKSTFIFVSWPCLAHERQESHFLISKFYREVIIIKIISLSPKVNSLGVLTIVFYRGKRKIYTCFGTNNNVPDISDLRSGEKQWLHFVAQTHGGGGGGGTPLHKPVVQYVLPQRIYFFLHRFGLKTDIHFAHFRLESSRVFEGTTGVYERICRCSFRWILRKKELCTKRI